MIQVPVEGGYCGGDLTIRLKQKETNWISHKKTVKNSIFQPPSLTVTTKLLLSQKDGQSFYPII